MARYQVSGMLNFSLEYEAESSLPSLQWRMEQQRALREKFKDFMEDLEGYGIQEEWDIHFNWDSAELVVDDTKTLSEAIHHASFHKTLHKLLARLDDFPDVNEKDKHGLTPLMTAAWMGNEDLVTGLLKRDANVNEHHRDGGTALHTAAGEGHAGVVNVLLQAGAEIDARDKYGMTALLQAAWRNHLTTVKVLLEQGANLSARDTAGRTALVYAMGKVKPVSVAEYFARLEAQGKMTDKMREVLRKQEPEQERTPIVEYLHSCGAVE